LWTVVRVSRRSAVAAGLTSCMRRRRCRQTDMAEAIDEIIVRRALRM
jgi:hypothetical protein